jgi:hypothetical protein
MQRTQDKALQAHKKAGWKYHERTGVGLMPQKCFDGSTKGLIIMLHGKGWIYKRLAKRFNCAVGTVRRYCTVYRRSK